MLLWVCLTNGFMTEDVKIYGYIIYGSTFLNTFLMMIPEAKVLLVTS